MPAMKKKEEKARETPWISTTGFTAGKLGTKHDG